MLVKQYIRAILELKPKAFIMENVSMLRSEIHRFYMERKDEEVVSRCNIPVKTTSLQLIDKEFGFDDALALIQDRELIKQHLWPDSTYSKPNVIYKAAKNADKLIKALKKHQKALMQAAASFVAASDCSYIALKSRKAFQAVLSSGRISAEKLHR